MLCTFEVGIPVTVPGSFDISKQLAANLTEKKGYINTFKKTPALVAKASQMIPSWPQTTIIPILKSRSTNHNPLHTRSQQAPSTPLNPTLPPPPHKIPLPPNPPRNPHPSNQHLRLPPWHRSSPLLLRLPHTPTSRRTPHILRGKVMSRQHPLIQASTPINLQSALELRNRDDSPTAIDEERWGAVIHLEEWCLW